MQSVHELTQENFNETFKRESVYRTSYDKLDEFINAMLGQDFELVADQELNNGTSWTTDVSSRDSLGMGDLRELDKFLDSGEYRGIAYQLMQYMYEKGMLHAGKYIVDVNW